MISGAATPIPKAANAPDTWWLPAAAAAKPAPTIPRRITDTRYAVNPCGIGVQFLADLQCALVVDFRIRECAVLIWSRRRVITQLGGGVTEQAQRGGQTGPGPGRQQHPAIWYGAAASLSQKIGNACPHLYRGPFATQGETRAEGKQAPKELHR